MSADANSGGTLAVPNSTNPVRAPVVPESPNIVERGMRKQRAESIEQSYGAFVRASLPQWLAMMDPAPWWAAGSLASPVEKSNATTVFRQQAATLAIALLAEEDEPGCDRTFLDECVGTSLIRWQMSLRSDGLPTRRSLRGSPLHALIAECIMHVLGHTGGFESDMLLGDLERHVAWLGRKRRRAPWLEATTIALMADTAVLIRDRAMLSRARHRISLLLHAQNEEGWFPERGGPDLGRLSLAVDALARLYRIMGWGELSRPLQAAVSFILHCLHPDGSIGGCISSCGTGFLSPYGVEQLAPVFSEAATLALECRRRLSRYASNGAPAWHADLWAILGPRVALASTVARENTAPPAVPPHRVVGTKHFPHAGISIHCSENYHAVIGAKSGGALQVCWQDGGILEEPGLAVFLAHGARTTGRWYGSTRTSHSATAVTSHGVLRRPYRSLEGRSSVLKRFLAPLTRRRHRNRPTHSAALVKKNLRKAKSRTRDLFRREVILGQDTIQIRDVVDTRARCQAVLCHSQPGGETAHLVDRSSLAGIEPPIHVEGDRHVEIRRIYGRSGLMNQDVQTGNR